jgi:hypothetical protein
MKGGHRHGNITGCRRPEPRHVSSVTGEACRELGPPFAAALQAPMASWRLDGRPRTARRYAPYTNGPWPTPEDRLLLIRVYLKTYPLQGVQGRLCGMGQRKAPRWLPVL